MITPILLGEIGATGWVIGGVASFLFFFFTMLAIWANRYMKVGPNQVLVISGRKHRVVDPDGNTREVGFKIRKGGGVFVLPVFEKVDILSLELLTTITPGMELVPDQDISYVPNALFRGLEALLVAPGGFAPVP